MVIITTEQKRRAEDSLVFPLNCLVTQVSDEEQDHWTISHERVSEIRKSIYG